jgi:hypothetical protein
MRSELWPLLDPFAWIVLALWLVWPLFSLEWLRSHVREISERYAGPLVELGHYSFSFGPSLVAKALNGEETQTPFARDVQNANTRRSRP